MIPKQKAITKCFRNKNGVYYKGYTDCSEFEDVSNILSDLRKKGKRCFYESQEFNYRIFVERKR